MNDFDRFLQESAEAAARGLAKAKRNKQPPDCDVCMDTGYCWGMASNGRGNPYETPMRCLDCGDDYEVVDEETFDAAYEDAGLDPKEYKPL